MSALYVMMAKAGAADANPGGLAAASISAGDDQGFAAALGLLTIPLRHDASPDIATQGHAPNATTEPTKTRPGTGGAVFPTASNNIAEGYPGAGVALAVLSDRAGVGPNVLETAAAGASILCSPAAAGLVPQGGTITAVGSDAEPSRPHTPHPATAPAEPAAFAVIAPGLINGAALLLVGGQSGPPASPAARGDNGSAPAAAVTAAPAAPIAAAMPMAQIISPAPAVVTTLGASAALLAAVVRVPPAAPLSGPTSPAEGAAVKPIGGTPPNLDPIGGGRVAPATSAPPQPDAASIGAVRMPQPAGRLTAGLALSTAGSGRLPFNDGPPPTELSGADRGGGLGSPILPTLADRGSLPDQPLALPPDPARAATTDHAAGSPSATTPRGIVATLPEQPASGAQTPPPASPVPAGNGQAEPIAAPVSTAQHAPAKPADPPSLDSHVAAPPGGSVPAEGLPRRDPLHPLAPQSSAGDDLHPVAAPASAPASPEGPVSSPPNAPILVGAAPLDRVTVSTPVITGEIAATVSAPTLPNTPIASPENAGTLLRAAPLDVATVSAPVAVSEIVATASPRRDTRFSDRRDSAVPVSPAWAAIDAPAGSGTPAAASAISVAAANDGSAAAVSVAALPHRLSEQLVQMASGAARDVVLQLHPPELGAVTVRVTVTGHDVSAWFAAPQPEVQQAISQAIGQLQTDLGNAGYNLSGAWVGGDGAAPRGRNSGPGAPAAPSRTIAAAAAGFGGGYGARDAAASGVSVYV